MAKQLSDVITNCRIYLDESNASDFTAAEVLSQINYSYHYVVSKVVEIYEEFYLTTTPRTYSTIADQQEYTLDTTLLKFERVEINMLPNTANSVAQRAFAIKMNELPLRVGNSLVTAGTTSTIGYYIIGSQSAQKIGFVPIPTQTGTNNISVWGIEAPSDLSANADPILIPYPDLFAEIVSKLAAGRLLKKGQQAVKFANDLIADAERDILNMQQFIVERQSDGVHQIQEAAWEDVNVGSPL